MFSRFPFWLYNLALGASAPLWLSYYGLRALRRRMSWRSLHERFAYRLPSLPAPTIWFHCVSVGEVLAGQPLAQALRERFPATRFAISTTTDAGQARAREQLAWMDAHIHFPLDLPWVMERALQRLNPTLVIILETEIWPNFLRACARRHIAVVLANGRLSDRSFGRYRRLGSSMGDLLGHFALCLMQSAEDADRIRALGAPATRVLTTGNLKYAPPDATERARRDRIAQSIQQQYGLGDGRPCIVAGSTVEGEEPLLAGVFAQLRQRERLTTCRLLVAPRHPERFAGVARSLQNRGWRVARRSQPQADDLQADIIVLDTIGELAAAYRWADVAFVGGSLVPRGGHNILEPAAEGRPIVTGPHTENFRAIIARFQAANAIWQLAPGPADRLQSALALAVETLLTTPARAADLAQRARSVWSAETGAVAAAMDALEAHVFPRLPALSLTQDG
ncbi:3-deoxy-D-manno-octulosonic acid transferase [Chloracidobacterium validum]|uniref:3-deoxy-D-manno-octulosonic acid transferase n=1 Tax=Chloracidobacterium validum TaxID=2821543 RepID=A0ABX8BDQ8_9BACT|nr:3-deoxy-D-manno-octulosonic acid transferase [Chloracidobacterium validum]QUW03794.1 3-deoxy-D-manno-octulosonic acid transferase [Chloracidobacterium validum]